MIAKVIDGRKIAKNLRSNISDEVKELVSKYKIVPNIVTIIIGDDPSSKLYLRLRDKACEEVGIKSSHVKFSADVSEEEVLQTINNLNDDNSVHGILIQFPIPKHISQDKLINSLNPEKDVEGFNPVNMGKTLIGDEYIIPCTPLAVLTILEHENIDLKGLDVTIVNHSNVVGKPLASLF